jgi:hypothetical protein
VVVLGTSGATASDSTFGPDTPEPGSVEAIADATTIRGVSSPIAKEH